MKTVSIGGGPAGLYFSLLTKKREPGADVRVYERNRSDDTFGFGVVFSDATLDNLAQVDAESYDEIRRHFFHWSDIDVVVSRRNGASESFRSRGHGFSGLSRRTLLDILQRRCKTLGVALAFETEIDADGKKASGEDVVADADLVLVADGINSAYRARHETEFGTEVDHRKNRFVWLGTSFPFDAFTFWFKETDAGLFAVHAYRYEEGKSTFIVECTEETFARAGLDENDEAATARYVEGIFEAELRGHPLYTNRSIWRRFPVVRNAAFSSGKFVLVGDALHTAHFSIGSGTKLALEDAIALRHALDTTPGIPAALAVFDAGRRAPVASLQRAAQTSLEWFENMERTFQHDGLTFTFSLLTRSLRVNHENLRVRDHALAGRVDAELERDAFAAAGVPLPAWRKGTPLPPMLTPLRLRDVVLSNRVVLSPMCMYSAVDGAAGDFHMVHLGSRIVGGAGLVLTEMTAISADARITEGCAGIYDDQHVAAFARIVRFAHDNGTKIGVQLGHAGRKGAVLPPWEDNLPLPAERAWPLLAASPLPWDRGFATPREMTEDDMARVTDDYVRAAERAAEAGFDWIELHAAHGYLLSTFLSPLTNQRRDAFGGAIEGRMRFPLSVFKAIRARFPQERAMSVRVSACDWAPGGISLEDVVVFARALVAAGCDLVSVSSGQTVSQQKPAFGRLYQVPFSEAVRIGAGVPTLAVGGITSAGDVNAILAARRADVVALARSHLFDPYWVRHAARSYGFDIPWPRPYGAMSFFEPKGA